MKPLQPYCVLFNDWLGAETFLWVETLVSQVSESTWKSIVTVQTRQTIPGSWAAKLEFSKAARAYSAETGTALGNVDEALLKGTDLGIQGWAEKFETLGSDVKPKPGGDGSNQHSSSAGKRPRAKAAPAPVQKSAAAGQDPGVEAGAGAGGEDGQPTKKPKNTKGENLVTKKEKEMKELLAQEQASDIEMTRIAANISRDPTWWGWAAEVVAEYKRHRATVLKLYSDHPFFMACKVAALSPKESAKLRKENKDNYLPQLCEFCTSLGPPISRVTEASFQLKEMAAAKLGATQAMQNTSPTATKGKGKPKAKAQSKRTGSSASLASS